jgi:hypothetical protein
MSSTSSSGKCTGCLDVILSAHNKLTLYKQAIHPVWSYGIQIWGCASESNIQVIQLYQNKVLKCIVNAPWHVRNSELHSDLRIEMVTYIIAKFANSHEKKKPSKRHQHRSIQTSQCKQYHQTTQTEETV